MYTLEDVVNKVEHCCGGGQRAGIEVTLLKVLESQRAAQAY